MKPSDARFYLTLALVAGGGYLLWRTFSGVKAVGTAITNVTDAAGSSLADKLLSWTNPYDYGSDLYLKFRLLDGSTHAVSSNAIAADGSFAFNGVNYTMKADASGNRVAIPA